MVQLSEKLKRPSTADDTASPDIDSAPLMAREDQVIVEPLVSGAFVKGT